ncbi:hypothetical protein BDFB_000144 [Asbolus verrucosus]|uniref:Uncharacterized protein n=1 Tax=Asbolus verrucosus TaxID=1661398 RepID=A0A482VV90_ASBVE|nr:hypothetical protein BDFB_000144 [Asbolus verrucosus]
MRDAAILAQALAVEMLNVKQSIIPQFVIVCKDSLEILSQDVKKLSSWKNLNTLVIHRHVEAMPYLYQNEKEIHVIHHLADLTVNVKYLMVMPVTSLIIIQSVAVCQDSKEILSSDASQWKNLLLLHQVEILAFHLLAVLIRNVELLVHNPHVLVYLITLAGRLTVDQNLNIHQYVNVKSVTLVIRLLVVHHNLQLHLNPLILVIHPHAELMQFVKNVTTQDLVLVYLNISEILIQDVDQNVSSIQTVLEIKLFCMKNLKLNLVNHHRVVRTVNVEW